MIKNNNYLDSLSKSLLNDVRGVMEGKKKECKCDNNCACGKEEKDEAEEKGEVKEAKKMKGEDPCWKDYKMVGTKKGKGGKEVPNCVPEETEVKSEAYNEKAVDKAISSSRQKIGGREAKKIHALLKGSTGYKSNKNAEDTKKTFPNVKHLTKDGHPDWKKHGMGEEVELEEEVDFAKVRKQFDRNEDRNAHSVNAVLIAKHAGTEEHHKEAKDILKQHNKLGHLSGDLSNRRQALYKQLEKTDNYKKIFPEHNVKEEVELEEGEEKGGGYNAPTAKGAMTYKKVLGQHTVRKGNTFHRSFPSEGDAVKYIQKNQSNEPKKKTYSYNEEVEIDEAKAESPIKGTRLISKHEGKDGHHAEVRHNSEYNEFQVHHYENGKHMGEGPVSYHDTKADAKEAAEYEVKNYRPKNGSLRKEEVELDEKHIVKYAMKSPKTGGKIYAAHYDSKEDAEKFLHSIKKDGGNGTISSVKEEVELDEMKGSTVLSHAQKAIKQLRSSQMMADMGAPNSKSRDERDRKRSKGLDMGDAKLGGYAKVNATEEVELDEKLIGKQHKLDKNKNGKLDKHDFKLLRKEETIEEKLNPSMGASKWVQDFVKSKDPRFEGKTKKERIKMALGAYYGAKNESVETEEVDAIDEAYGKKTDYKKHHISVNGRYIATTTWARDAKEAEKKFIEQHPEHKNARITVVKER
jgi:hypothetical protein